MYLINSNDKFELVGVAIIPELLNSKTNNPIDNIYKFAYKGIIEGKNFGIYKSLSIFIIRVLKNLLSVLYSKYADYLLFLLTNRIRVLEENKISTFSDIDVIVVNNWWKIDDEVLSTPRYGCVNIHPSALPKYRGSVPTLWALKNKDDYGAVSFIVMNSEIDKGSIINQHGFPINQYDNSIDLEYKIENIISKYLLEDICKYIEGKLIPYEQTKEFASSTAKYYDYMQINFNTETSYELYNKILLYPYLFPMDLCYFSIEKKKYFLQNASISSRKLKPGLRKRIGLNLYIGCIDGRSIKIKLFRDLCLKQSFYLMFNF